MAPACASGVCEPLDPRVAPDGSTKHRASRGVVGLTPSPPAVSKALRLGSGDLVSRRSQASRVLSSWHVVIKNVPGEGGRGKKGGFCLQEKSQRGGESWL